MTDEASFGDDVEKWLAEGTDLKRLAAPARSYLIPGLGPRLIIAVLGWPDSITVIYVEPDMGPDAEPTLHRMVLRDDTGVLHRLTSGGGGGSNKRQFRHASFDGPLPEGSRAVHLYGLQTAAVLEHRQDDPMPDHVTIPLD